MLTQIEIKLRRDKAGKIIPIYFLWEGDNYPITSIDKRWLGKDGEHFLVGTSRYQQAFELLYKLNEGRWFMLQREDHTTVAP